MQFLQGPRFAARLGFTLIVGFFLTCMVFTWMLPSDNTVRSLLRFHWHRTAGLFQTPMNEQKWIFQREKYPVNFHNDVGLLIKTGYGTQDRVLAQMEAMGLEGTRNAVIVAGNFNTTLVSKDISVEVTDVIGRMFEEKEMVDWKEYPRAEQYYSLRDAIASGNEEKAQGISKESGWDMDILKFIPGLELAWNHAPYRKWWIIMDDDTFIVKSSLTRVLSHLDPAQDQYIGNAIGDYKSRFAHGGAAIAVSQRTMQHLFERPDLITEAKKLSLSEPYGDRLVGATLMKLGIYLDEEFSNFFVGEPPKMVRISPDNFCLPIASFHGVDTVEKMETVGKIIKEQDNKVIYRGQIWPMYKEPDIRFFAANPVRKGHDHVGRMDDTCTTIENVATAMDCVGHCDKPWSSCLAWTWDERSFQCKLAPWTLIGDNVIGKASGVHYPRAMDIGARCEESMKNGWKNNQW